MKRFLRWIWNLYSLLSLLLCVTVMILWYASYHAHNVVWMRNEVSQNGHHLRTDWFVCDRGRLGWSGQESPLASRASFNDPNRNTTRWWSYAREDYSTRWS